VFCFVNALRGTFAFHNLPRPVIHLNQAAYNT
jgi:hypothetical protein